MRLILPSLKFCHIQRVFPHTDTHTHTHTYALSQSPRSQHISYSALHNNFSSAWLVVLEWYKVVLCTMVCSESLRQSWRNRDFGKLDYWKVFIMYFCYFVYILDKKLALNTFYSTRYAWRTLKLVYLW
jgi:hypothetical protein